MAAMFNLFLIFKHNLNEAVQLIFQTLLGFFKFNNSEEKHMSLNIIFIRLYAHKNE